MGHICRTPQLVGNFEALRFIEAEEKRKNKAENGKRREKLEKRKTNLQPHFVGCKIGAFFTIKLSKKCQKWSISILEMRCGPYIYIYIYIVFVRISFSLFSTIFRTKFENFREHFRSAEVRHPKKFQRVAIRRGTGNLPLRGVLRGVCALQGSLSRVLHASAKLGWGP